MKITGRKTPTHPGRVGVLCHHEHEVKVDQVCAAADADDAALQVGLRLSNGLERRQDLGILRGTASGSVTGSRCVSWTALFLKKGGRVSFMQYDIIRISFSF